MVQLSPLNTGVKSFEYPRQSKLDEINSLENRFCSTHHYCIFFAKAMGFIGGSVAESYMESNNEDRVIQILADNIGDMRAQLPIVVDEITILEKVDLEGLNIIYEYKIELSDLNPSEISTFSFNLKNENTKMACNNPDLHEILEAGIKYHYNYYDLDNNRIPGFEVSKAICANFQYQAPR